jgi:hypothetical protein
MIIQLSILVVTALYYNVRSVIAASATAATTDATAGATAVCAEKKHSLTLRATATLLFSAVLHSTIVFTVILLSNSTQVTFECYS